MENTTLRIGTYNLRNITDHYHLRLPLLKNTVNKMNIDIAGFQEVSFVKNNQLDNLFAIHEYIQYNALTQLNYGKANKIIDENFNIDGNSFVVKKEKLGEDSKFEILHLSPVRNCCMLSIKFLNGVKISIVNTHLHHTPSEELIRLYQTQNMLRWIEMNTSQDDLVIVLGDFNALPGSDTYNYFIENGYISAHSKHHSCEPIKTFHNKMDAPYKDTDDEGTFDYIFIKHKKDSKFVYNIKSVEIFGEEECEINKGIFASDHYGIVVELMFDMLS